MYLSRVIKMVFLLSLLALLVPASLARGQTMGTAVIRSSSPGLSDQMVVNLVDVSILGTDEVYEGWLVSDDGSESLSIGVMAVDADGAVSHTYTNADGLNLVSKYDTFKITVEPVPDTDTGPSTHTVYSDTIPAAGMMYIRHLLHGCECFGLADDAGITVKLWQQADIAHQQAALGVAAATLSDIQTYAHTVINVIEGSDGTNYDASAGDPGDGHGVLSHAADTKDHVGKASAAVPTDSTIVKYSSNASDSSDNVVTWSGEARNHALDAISATSITVAKAYMTNATTLMARSRDGYDADRDATIESITGEGGAIQVHVAAQDMATYHPSTFVPAPTPAPTPEPTPEPAAAPPETGGISLTTYAWGALASSFFLIIGGSYLLRRRSTN